MTLFVETRAASSEISGGKFPEIYSNLSGNLLQDLFHRYVLITIKCLEVQHCKVMP